MISPTDTKESIFPKVFPSPPSLYDDENMAAGGDEIDDFTPMDSIVVESAPLSPSPPPNVLSPPPPGQEDASMRSLPSDEQSMSDEDEDEGPDNDGDDEDEEEESDGLDAAALQQQYIVPVKEADDVDDSARDLSENSLSVNGHGSVAKIEFGESLTRGGKLRRLAPPPPLKRRKTPMGRSRTPRAPSPVIPQRSTSPWPEIKDSDIRDMEDRDVKRRRTSTRQETNGTGETTPQPAPSRNSRRQGKEETVISAEERLKRSKRVKISPRKEKQVPNRQRSPPHPLTAALGREEAVSGSATPRFIINMKAAEKEDSDPTRYNEEICGACGGPGRFLCCEGCPKSFHFTCLDPPIDENDLPEDSWYSNPQAPTYLVGIVHHVAQCVIHLPEAAIVSLKNLSTE